MILHLDPNPATRTAKTHPRVANHKPKDPGAATHKAKEHPGVANHNPKDPGAATHETKGHPGVAKTTTTKKNVDKSALEKKLHPTVNSPAMAPATRKRKRASRPGITPHVFFCVQHRALHVCDDT